MNRIIILGSSEGVIKTIQEWRSRDRSSEIIFISLDGAMPYNRDLFDDFLRKKIPLQKIFYKSKDFFEKNNVQVVLDKTIERINLKKHKIQTTDHQQFEYDLLVITQPPDYRLPQIKGIHREGVCTFKKIRDIETIVRILPMTEVIGLQSDSLEGLKTAFLFLNLGKEVLWMSQMPSFFSQILSSEHKGWLLNYLETKRLRILEENPIVELLGEKDLKAVRLKTGKVLACPMVIFPDAEEDFHLFADSPLNIHKRICVDDNFKTNVDNVLAVDLACELVSKNKEGTNDSESEEIKEHSFEAKDFTLDILADTKEGPGIKTSEHFDSAQAIFKKVFIRENTLKGAFLVNAREQKERFLQCLKGKVDLCGKEEMLLDPGVSFESFMNSQQV